MKIIWSERAFQNFKAIITYLENNWTEVEIRRFISRSEKYLFIIQNNPEAFPISTKKKSIRRCVVSKQMTLYYKIQKEQITLVTLFDSRQDPAKRLL